MIYCESTRQPLHEIHIPNGSASDSSQVTGIMFGLVPKNWCAIYGCRAARIMFCAQTISLGIINIIHIISVHVASDGSHLSFTNLFEPRRPVRRIMKYVHHVCGNLFGFQKNINSKLQCENHCATNEQRLAVRNKNEWTIANIGGYCDFSINRYIFIFKKNIGNIEISGISKCK